MNEEERKRKESIETRSGILIGLLAVVITFIVKEIDIPLIVSFLKTTKVIGISENFKITIGILIFIIDIVMLISLYLLFKSFSSFLKVFQGGIYYFLVEEILLEKEHAMKVQRIVTAQMKRLKKNRETTDIKFANYQNGLKNLRLSILLFSITYLIKITILAFL